MKKCPITKGKCLLSGLCSKFLKKKKKPKKPLTEDTKGKAIDTSKDYEQLDCIMCGWCCGYRRDSYFGGASYQKGERVPRGIKVNKTDEGYTIPVDEEDTCIYLEKLNNGFTRCSIHNKRPEMCKNYNCLPKQKARNLQRIVDELKEK